MRRVLRVVGHRWTIAAFLAAWYGVVTAVDERIRPLGRFDDGILASSVTFLVHGQLPYTDFYQPYGPAIGLPGAVPAVFGADGMLAQRLTYLLFGVLATFCCVLLVARRCGTPLSFLAGLACLQADIPRYSASWAFVLGGLLMLDVGAERAGVRGLGRLAAARPRLVLAVAAVVSLAGWVRTEYALFGGLFALTLLIVLRRAPRRIALGVPAAALILAALPVATVLATGGAQGLWWWLSYSLSRGPDGFAAQRGEDIDWSLFGHRLHELASLQLSSGDSGAVLVTYGVAGCSLIAGIVLLSTRRGRRRLAADPTGAVPMLLVVNAIVLFGQSARFSATYGLIALPIFAATAFLLVGRHRPLLTGFVGLLLVWPTVIPSALPNKVLDRWRQRPITTAREAIPRLDRIPMIADGGPESLAALAKAWRRLGLDNRPVLSVGRHNDLAWGNDAIVAYVLNAPSAGWPLTFDPGLETEDRVQRRSVDDLCSSHGAVVQLDGDYPYPAGVEIRPGARRLDAFLALSYDVRARAGFYRILLPRGEQCTRPDDLSAAAIRARRDLLFDAGDLPAAGALSDLLMRRFGSDTGVTDAAFVALGGYRPQRHSPASPLSPALEALADKRPDLRLTNLAARRWDDDVQALAAQTAWVRFGRDGRGPVAAAAAAVLRTARRHPGSELAIENVAAIQPPSPELFADLARRGASGPAFDRWRLNTAKAAQDVPGAIEAGLALVADEVRASDPVGAGATELELADLPLPQGCSDALRRRANARDGVYVSVGPGPTTCAEPLLSRAP